MTFADKIKIARAAQHLTQQELANRCGLSLRTIQNYELGTRKPKSGTIYTVLAEALGVPRRHHHTADGVFRFVRHFHHPHSILQIQYGQVNPDL